MLPDDLFSTGRGLVPVSQRLGGKLPVILVDDVYEQPERVRDEALKLEFKTPPYPYPGKIADIPPSNSSLATFLRNLLELVNGQYLSRVPVMIAADVRPITAFRRIMTDFGIIDLHPDELAPN